MERSNRTAFWFSLSAFVCLAVTQAIFFTFTYPMNAASSSWTVMPEQFEIARFQWEYSHAVNAGLTFVAFSLSRLRSSRTSTKKAGECLLTTPSVRALSGVQAIRCPSQPNSPAPTLCD